jgi:hypothetical protein
VYRQERASTEQPSRQAVFILACALVTLLSTSLLRDYTNRHAAD